MRRRELYILLENMNIERIRSKKELYEHMRSLIELLCKDRKSRMYFMSMSGECDVWVDEEGCVKRLEREGCGMRRGLKESE